jgi:hypothetical protein
VTSSRRNFHQQSRTDHGGLCRLLLRGQMARAGEAWSCPSPHADVTPVASNGVRAGSCGPCHGSSPRAHGGQATARAGCVGEQPQQKSAATGAWADCQSAMAHGTEQRHHAKAPTPEFSIYATLLQETTDHGFQQLFAANCNSPCSIACRPCRTLLSRHPWSPRGCSGMIRHSCCALWSDPAHGEPL